MPKRRKPLSGACFASGQVTTQIQLWIENVIALENEFDLEFDEPDELFGELVIVFDRDFQGVVQKLEQLSVNHQDLPFMFWWKPPLSWRSTSYVLEPLERPFFDQIGQIVQPLLEALGRTRPFAARQLGGHGYIFDNYLWDLNKDEQHHNEDEVALFFLEAFDQERQKVERLRRKFSSESIADCKRHMIAERVRIFVWRRDGGRCTMCGSQDRLEFDHIIPFSRGGSSTERNVQLLCEACNRKKSASV